MPIRHCQKCGLKVLIDESQGNINPFYCQRCSAALRVDGAPGTAAAASGGRLTPVSTPQPAGVVTAAGTVKVHCPYCKASFNGRVPLKPARGQCPLCQKDLILLPNGDIRPAAGFDLTEWQKAGPSSSKPPEEAPDAAPPKESGTRMLVKKYAADPAAMGAKAESGTRILGKLPAPPPPPPPADTDIADPAAPASLPDWMDDAAKPPPPPAPKAAAETDIADAVRLEDLLPSEPPPPPPPPPRGRAAAGATPRPAPPPPITPPPQPAPKRSGGTGVMKKTTAERPPARSASAAGIESPQGAGKFMLGLALVAIPLIACPVLLTQREALKDTPIEKLGSLFSKGFLELDAKLFPVEEPEKPPPPKPPPPPAPEAPVQPSAEDKAQWEREITKLIEQTNRRKRDLATGAVGATPEQKAAFKEVQAEQDRQLNKLGELQGTYKKFYGSPYDPEKQ